MNRRALSVVVVVGLATAGTVPDPPLALSLPDGVDIAVEFPRYLMVERRLEVIVDNASDVPLTVIDVALRSPLFEPVDANEHGYTVPAGRRQDLKMDVGASICPSAEGPTMIEMTVDLDGERRHGTVTVDPSPIAAINATECGEQFVRAHATVGFGPDFRVDGEHLETTVTVTRRSGDEPIALTAVRGSVLYVVQPVADTVAERGPIIALDPDATTASTAVTMHVGRCEPHAVGDAKKPFQFAVWATIGDSEPTFVTVVPGTGIQDALHVLTEACAARLET